MAQLPPFKFTLQLALQKAEAERDTCARGVADVRAQITAEERRLDELVAAREAAAARARAEERALHDLALRLGAAKRAAAVQPTGDPGDNLATDAADVSAEDLIEGARYMDVLRAAEAAAADAIARQRQAIDRLNAVLETKLEELAEKMNEVKGLEKLRDTRRAEYDREKARLEEIAVDDQALELFERRRIDEGRR